MRNVNLTETDARLALSQGREAGLDYFFHQYYAPLTYFASKLLDDPCQGEEIAAEAFVKLWHNRQALAAHPSIKAWLYTTVRNAAIDHLRKAKRLRVSIDGLQTPETVERSVLHRLVETETVNQIVRTLDLLPAGCRQVFQLYYFEGKSHDEIAKELELSPHTVRNQKFRAIRILKEKLPFIPLVFVMLASL